MTTASNQPMQDMARSRGTAAMKCMKKESAGIKKERGIMDDEDDCNGAAYECAQEEKK